MSKFDKCQIASSTLLKELKKDSPKPEKVKDALEDLNMHGGVAFDSTKSTPEQLSKLQMPEYELVKDLIDAEILGLTCTKSQFVNETHYLETKGNYPTQVRNLINKS